MSAMRIPAVIASSILILGSLHEASHAATVPAPVRNAASEAVSAGWMVQVQQDLAEKEYELSWQAASGLEDVGDAWQAPNRAHGFRTWFTPDGIRVVPRAEADPTWRWGLALTGLRRGDLVESIPRAVLSTAGNRIEYRRGAITERYENTPAGLKQVFILPPPRPAGTRAESPDSIHLDLVVWGDLSPRVSREGQAIDFVDGSDTPMLRYGQLEATDARGARLQARMETFADPDQWRARLVVEDVRTAVAPISIAAVATIPIWTVQSDQPTSRFGASVATAGDVNGDGYSDVIVGAHLYDSGQTDVGKAFLYLGSPSGPSTTPAWTAEGSTAAMEFARSVAPAGDVNADGYGDVVVGGASASFVSQGVAQLYLGSAAGLSSSPAWTAVSEPSSVTTFGWSVAPAGDVNGDGHDDIIIGDPDYSGAPAGFRAGKVYVYLGQPAGLAATPAWTATGLAGQYYLGTSVSTAGDVNGDGYADIVTSAPGYWDASTGTILVFGRVDVYLGSATGPAPTPAWTRIGDQWLGGYGSSVATAGDVNGDGYADVLVGADTYSNGESSEGRVYGYLGSSSGLSASPAWVLESNSPNARLGNSVATAGDVDGDGYADVVVGAHLHVNGAVTAGKAFIHLGSAEGLGASPVWTTSGAGITSVGYSVATAGDVNGDGYSDVFIGAPVSGYGFIWLGAAAGLVNVVDWEALGTAQEDLGWSVASAGDVNGDGFSDVIVGAPAWDNSVMDAGRALVFLGSPDGLSPTAAWVREGDVMGGCLGVSVASAGDVNGDGYSDVIIGASGFGPESESVSGPGHAEVFLGSPIGLGIIPAWSMTGEQVAARFGESVATAGDVNGDGYSDVIVGARDFTNGQSLEGRAYVYLGSPLGLPMVPAWIAEGDLASAHFGTSVSSAGDVNGDGYSDVVVGAFGYDDGVTIGGRVSVYLGSESGLATTPTWIRGGDIAGEWFGYSVGTAGDANADGYSDLVVGSPLWNFSGQSGRASLFLGSSSGTLTFRLYSPGQNGEHLGVSVSPAGDVDGDGFADYSWLSYARLRLRHGSANLSSGTDTTLLHAAGDSVAAAGDVNGDGYADVITGFVYGGDGSGVARVFHGNGGAGRHRVPAQMRPNGPSPVALLGRTGLGTSVRLKMRGLTPAGRGKLRMQWEVKPIGAPFDSSGLGVSAVQDTGTPGTFGSAASFNQTVTGLVENSNYRWRARSVSSSPFFPRSPWVTIPSDTVTQTKFRTRVCPDLDGDGHGAVSDPSCQGWPVPDCNDSASDVWATPGEVLDLTFTSPVDLAWEGPAEPGTPTSALLFDTLRSLVRNDFVSPATVCLESDDGPWTTATDADLPALGQAFYYLVRAQNGCPAGEGSLGADSFGGQRQGRSCP